LAVSRGGLYDARMLVRIITLLATVLALAFAAGCGGDDAATTEEPAAEQTQTPTATAEEAGGDATAGRETFVNTCGGCHTLADAESNGQVGPNLDQVAPDRDTVLTAIETGPGQMPENLLEGEEARAVADYVAANAGG
jgi:mono/diheme cytochrome c family protein